MNKRSIIRRMIRIYQMWLFIRMVEGIVLDETKTHKPFTRAVLCAKFTSKRKWFGRGKEYNADEALRAYFIARSRGYLEEVGDVATGNVKVKDEGFYMTSPSYFIAEMSKTIVSVSNILAVVIAAIALYVSVSKH